jgi:hypothetical protein
MRRSTVVTIAAAVCVAFLLGWLWFEWVAPAGSYVQGIYAKNCEPTREDARQTIQGELPRHATDGRVDWDGLLNPLVDEIGYQSFRCANCLHAYVFNPDPAAWGDDAGPATILIVCPGPHHGKPDNLMFATTRDGTALEIQRDQPPAWFQEGVRATGVEGRE